MSDTNAGLGKVVVNRAMSVDGFIAGPDDAMDWVIEYTKKYSFPEVMHATGAMLVGRGTYEVAKRLSDQDTEYDVSVPVRGAQPREDPPGRRRAGPGAPAHADGRRAEVGQRAEQEAIDAAPVHRPGTTDRLPRRTTSGQGRPK